jgi:hypothetical protein
VKEDKEYAQLSDQRVLFHFVNPHVPPPPPPSSHTTDSPSFCADASTMAPEAPEATRWNMTVASVMSRPTPATVQPNFLKPSLHGSLELFMKKMVWQKNNKAIFTVNFGEACGILPSHDWGRLETPKYLIGGFARTQTLIGGFLRSPPI